MKNREVFLVLELNGPSYRRYVEYAKAIAGAEESKEEAARILKEAQHESSRLFAIDAGLNADALRKQYPDRKMYSITKGIVGANWQTSDDDKPVLNTYINPLNVERLHVAKPYDSVFTGMTMTDGKLSSKFEVGLVYGKRHEPWISSAKRTGK